MLSFLKSASAQLAVVLDRNLTVANALDRACKTHPERPLFHLDAPLPYRRLSGMTITCQQLRSFANRVSNALKLAGLQRYDRVAVFKNNSPDYFFLALAIIRAGAIAVPINPGMRLADLQYYLGYTGAKFLITDADLYEKRIATSGNCPGISTWVFPDAPPFFTATHIDLNRALESVSEELSPVHLNPDSDIIIAHTSGTTGFPKGVISTSGSLLRSARAQFLLGPVTQRDKTAVACPFNHLVAHTGMFSAMLGNLPLCPITRLDAPSILECIEKERITIFFAFPDIYLDLYNTGLDDRRLSSMRIWVGTADTSHDVHKRAFAQTGASIRFFGRRLLKSVFVDAFGSSEIGFAALTKLTFSFSKPCRNRLLGTPNPSGPRVKIADENGRRLPAGTIGRFMVKGPTLFKAYWNAHNLLHGTMENGWWWTGDVGYRDRWGRFYHLDRAADVIHTSNGAVYSLLVEEILMNHPDVSEAAVFAVKHPDQGTVAVAVVNGKPGKVPDQTECLAWANKHLQNSPGLQSVFVVKAEETPRGLTGKVLKRTLRERYLEILVREQSTDAVSLPDSLLTPNPGSLNTSNRMAMRRANGA